MQLAEIPPGSPPELLAWDEAFLDSVENGGEEVLWFWESMVHFVVVGYGQDCAREADLEACLREGIPVLRRCSGGGTVLQGRGCLSYGLVLRTENQPELQTITGTNRWIMERQARALNRHLDGTVVVRGHTDLARVIQPGLERKFSGNAQRRRQRALLFHGTLLHEMDLPMITRLLRQPHQQPDYRVNRPHAEFLANLPLSAAQIRTALVGEWQVSGPLPELPVSAHRRAMDQRYRQPDWHAHRYSGAYAPGRNE